MRACRNTHVISIRSAQSIKTLSWLVAAAGKLHKHRGTCCTADWAYCPFAILTGAYTQPRTHDLYARRCERDGLHSRRFFWGEGLDEESFHVFIVLFSTSSNFQQNQGFFFPDTLSSGVASCNQQRTFNTASSTEKKMEKKQGEFKTPPRSTERQSN